MEIKYVKAALIPFTSLFEGDEGGSPLKYLAHYVKSEPLWGSDLT